jgi:tetratricopeptide (TPR) repeat protein
VGFLRLSQPDWLELRRIQEGIVSLRTKLLGEADNSTLNGKAELGITLTALGEASKALELKEEIVATRRLYFGSDDRRTLVSIQNLAETYARMGHFQDAITASREVVDRRTRLFGVSHPQTMAALGRVAAMEAAQHRANEIPDEPKPSKRREIRQSGALSQSEKVADRAEPNGGRPGGLDDPSAESEITGSVVSYQKLLRSLLDLEREELAFRVESSGLNDPDTLRNMNELASTLKKLGAVSEARRLQEDALSRRRDQMGKDHMDTLNSIHWLADTLHELGEFTVEYQLRHEEYEARRRLSGAADPETVRSQIDLARVLRGIGRGVEAQRLCEDFISTRGAFADSDPLIVNAIEELALCRADDLQFEAAVELLNKTIENRRRHFGGHPLLLLRSIQNLASIYFRMGRFDDAYDAQTSALGVLIEMIGDGRPEVVELRAQLSISLAALGRLSEAYAVCEANLAEARILLGQNHPATLLTSGVMASLLVDLGHFSQARHLATETKERARRELGPAHLSTLEASRVLKYIDDSKM